MTHARGALAYTIGSLNPFLASTAGALAVLSHVHDPLMRRDLATGMVRPGLLARAPEQVGESAYLLELSENARFHNGALVGSDDVVASIRALMETTESGQLAGALGSLRSVEPRSGRRIQLTTDGPLPLLGERLSLVRVAPASALVADSSDNSAFVGTGPFKIVEADSLAGVVLELADTYSDREGGNISTVELVPCPDSQARIDGLIAGNFLAVEDSDSRSLKLIEGNPHLTSQSVSGLNMLWLMFNCSDPNLRHLPVRQALSLVLDREALAEMSNGEYLTPATGFLPNTHEDYFDAREDSTLNRTRARELLEKAGFDQGIELDLLVSSASWVEKLAPLVVEQLSQVGVTVNMHVAHTADLFAGEIPAGHYQMLLASGDPTPYGVDGEFILRWYLSGNWARRYSHWNEPVVDEIERLLNLASRSNDSAQRGDVLRQVQVLAAKNVPMTVLCHRAQPTAWSTRLQNFRPSRTTGLDLRGVRL